MIDRDQYDFDFELFLGWCQCFGADIRQVESGLGYEITYQGSVSKLLLVPRDYHCSDGQVINADIQLLTTLADVSISTPNCNRHNVDTGLFSLHYDPGTGRHQLCSRISLYTRRTPDRAFHPWLLFTALLQQNSWVTRQHNEPATLCIGGSLPDTRDFFNAGLYAQYLQLPATAGVDRLACTLPLGHQGDQPKHANFYATTGERHSLWGPGLQFALALPPLDPTGETIALARQLNHQEIRYLDAPPALGAWCATGPEATQLQYRGFIPAACYWPGQLCNLISWFRARAWLAPQQISDARARLGNAETIAAA